MGSKVRASNCQLPDFQSLAPTLGDLPSMSPTCSPLGYQWTLQSVHRGKAQNLAKNGPLPFTRSPFRKNAWVPFSFFHLEIWHECRRGASLLCHHIYAGLWIMSGTTASVIPGWKWGTSRKAAIKLLYGFNLNKSSSLMLIFMCGTTGCGVDLVKGFHWASGPSGGLRDLCHQ